MNNLARLGNVKADLAGVPSVTVLDDVLARAVDQVSRELERECKRHFYAYSGTRYYQGVNPGDPILALPDDLISVTSLTIDYDWDGVYETTLTENSDFVLGPYNAAQKGEPYWNLELLFTAPSGLTYWPYHPRAVKLTGIFGYSNETEDTGLTGTLSDTSDTTITASGDATNLIYPGDTLVIESEQVYVSAVSGTTVTVTRAVNGTTAAAHAAKSLLVRRYPRDVEMAVAERVVGLRWDSQGGYSTAATLVGDATGAAGTAPIRASYARWRRAVDRYSLPVVV